MVTLEDLAVRLERLERRLDGNLAALCTAEFPHPNDLVFMRGPNVYQCQCGQRYVKDGKGGLREAI